MQFDMIIEKNKEQMDLIEADLKKIIATHRSGGEVSAEMVDEMCPMVKGLLTPTHKAFFAKAEKQVGELRRSLGLPEEGPTTPRLEAPHNTPTTNLILPRETDMSAVGASLIKYAMETASLESVLTACEPEEEEEDVRTSVAVNE